MIRARRIMSIVQDAQDVCKDFVPVAVALISCLLACLGLWLELRAAWVWVETGVYTAPLLGTVFPGVAQDVDASLAQLALTRPWLVPAARTVLVDLWAEAHVGLLGIFLSVGVVSFCAYLSDVADPKPSQPKTPSIPEQLSWLRLYRDMRIARGDMETADMYRRWITSLEEKQALCQTSQTMPENSK